METRRQFLVDTSLSPLGVEAASFQTHGRAAKAFDPFPTLNYITSDSAYSDYRPAIDSAAQQVVFERTPKAGTTSLYILSLAKGAPQAFVQSSGHFSTGPSQTRPDWSWKTCKVAMNVAEADGKPVSILITDANGNPLKNVPDSKHYVYPTW